MLFNLLPLMPVANGHDSTLNYAGRLKCGSDNQFLWTVQAIRRNPFSNGVELTIREPVCRKVIGLNVNSPEQHAASEHTFGVL
jgi:hypothetical protein